MKTIFTGIILIFCYLKPSAQTLHAIFISDFTNQQFSLVSHADENIMKGISLAASQALGYKIDTISLHGSYFNATAIKKNVQNITTTPNDIIVFFYSGRGLSSKKSLSPILQLSNLPKEEFSFDDVEMLIKAKNVRFSLVIGDFIDEFSTTNNNSYYSTFGFQDMSNFNNRYSKELTQKLVLQKLFLEPCGILKISSFKKGSSSYSLPGYHISSLISQFSDELQKVLFNSNENIKTINWGSFLDNVKENADKKLMAFIPETKSQALVWELKRCNDSFKGKITQWKPPTQSFPTDNELNSLLNLLANEANETKQKELILQLKNICVDSAMVYIEGINTTKIEDAILNENLTIEKYIEKLTQYDKNLTTKIKIRFTQKSEDSIKIIGIWLKELIY